MPRRRAALLACLPLLLSACSSSPPTPEDQEDMDPEQKFSLYRETALFHYDNGDMSRAESQALKALAIHPDDPDLKILVGWASMRRGTNEDMIQAHGVFQSLEDSDDYRAWLGLATAKGRLGLGYDEAAEDFASGRRLPEDETTDVPALVEELRADARRYWEDSSALFRRVLDERPDERLAIQGLHRVSLQLGDFEGALGWAQRLIDQTAAELTFFRAQLRREELSVEEEDRLRRNERQLLDIEIQTRLTVARTMRLLDRTDEAVDQLDRVIVASPEEPEALSLRGQFRCELGLWAEAIDDLDAFLSVTGLPATHPDVSHAFDLRDRCEQQLRAAANRP